MIRLPPHFTLLQVTPELETGGVEQTTIDVARAVVRAGGRCLVASRGGRMVADLEAAGGELVELPVHSKNPFVWAANARTLTDLGRQTKVSLIHVRSRAPAFAAIKAARTLKVPVVSTYHGIYSATGPIKRWYNGVMTRADQVIANSAFTRDHVIAEHGVDPAKVTAIPRGVDLTRFDPGTVDEDRIDALRSEWGIAPGDPRAVLLLAGRLTPWKGQGLLIEALSRLKARGQDQFVAVLAGDEQKKAGYRRELQSRIAQAGLSEHVKLAGHGYDMPAAYLAADLALAPSTKPEAFGRTAVEPQAMGRPVLAACHGAAEETVANGITGWLVPPNDPDAWADAIDEALSVGPHAWSRMGQEGIARVRSLFSVDTMTQATLALYLDVLRSSLTAAR